MSFSALPRCRLAVFPCAPVGCIKGLGYDGISNMLAVEFDTYYNPDLSEPYENHVSVQTR